MSWDPQAVGVSSQFQILSHLTDFHRDWYEYANTDNLNIALSKYLHSRQKGASM